MILLKIINKVLNSEADVNQKYKSGISALALDTSCGYLELIKFLLKNKAKRNIRNNQRRNSLIIAIDDSLEYGNLFLKNNAAIEYKY